MPEAPILIDSDNAIESRRGDVDDAFAIAALLRSDAPVAALASVAGNTDEASASLGNDVLARLCGFQRLRLRGRNDADSSDVARWLASQERIRIAALGPLTNIGDALAIDPTLSSRIEDLVVIGGNATSIGRWPPLWPHDFNLPFDRDAAIRVFESRTRLTFVTLDVAIALRVGPRDLRVLEGAVGAYLARKAERWLRRCRLVKLRNWFPVWDLVGALWLLEPRLFRTREVRASMRTNTWVDFSRGSREVRLIESFDRDELWGRFVELLAH